MHNYTFLELVALLENQFGTEALRSFQKNHFPLIRLKWIDQSLHKRAFEAILTRDENSISFVDQISFLFLRDHSIDRVFSFDEDFRNKGFTLLEP